MIKDFTENINLVTEDTRVDEQNGTVSGCCILKPESRNNRVYSGRALNSVCNFGDVKSFLDHGNPLTGGSSVRNLFGCFTNFRRSTEGVYANLNLLKESSMFSQFMEIVKRFPKLAGFSIAARGKVSDKPDMAGREVVEDILELRSIDLVGNPASTNGMFESFSTKKKSLEEQERELIKAIKDRARNPWGL